jgi:hypothetical protein
MIVIQGIFIVVRYLQEGAFILLKNSLVVLIPNEPPKEVNDACIFSMLLLCSCSAKERNPVCNVTFVEWNERRMHLKLLP